MAEFDHVVHHRDVKTGRVNRINDYSMLCVKDKKYYRRGKQWYDAAGNPIEDPKVLGVREEVQQPFTRSQNALAASGVAAQVVAPQAPAVTPSASGVGGATSSTASAAPKTA